MFEDESVDTVLYDPPYSPRQVSECYKNLGQAVNMQTTQASYWSKQKEQIGRIVKPNGILLLVAGIAVESVRSMDLKLRKYY